MWLCVFYWAVLEKKPAVLFYTIAVVQTHFKIYNCVIASRTVIQICNIKQNIWHPIVYLIFLYQIDRYILSLGFQSLSFILLAMPKICIDIIICKNTGQEG